MQQRSNRGSIRDWLSATAGHPYTLLPSSIESVRVRYCDAALSLPANRSGELFMRFCSLAPVTRVSVRGGGLSRERPKRNNLHYGVDFNDSMC